MSGSKPLFKLLVSSLPNGKFGVNYDAYSSSGKGDKDGWLGSGFAMFDTEFEARLYAVGLLTKPEDEFEGEE